VNVVGIIQARMGSSRLPGKVLLPIIGKPMLEIIVDRVGEVDSIDMLVVATSVSKQDDQLACVVGGWPGVELWRGSEEDVLHRYFEAASAYNADVILRVTADNPFFHGKTADSLIKMLREGYDYVSNDLVHSFPLGIGLEVFRFEALASADSQAIKPYQREHVTPYLRENPNLFRLGNLELARNWSHIRLTVDTEEDYLNAKALFERFGVNVQFEEVVQWLDQS
jgi:spore coat polysaccharide biosynthesis protein SpsF